MAIDELPPIKESEFNSSVATLRRLDEIKKHLDVATVENDPDKKYYLIKAFIQELTVIIAKREQDKHLNTYDEIRRHYQIYKKGDMHKDTMMDYLDAFELDLRRTDQAHNLNMKMGRDKRWVV